MKKILSVLCFFLLGMVGTVDATIIDPATGWDGNFYWEGGLGQEITYDGSPVTWEIDVETDSTMRVEVKDTANVAPDEPTKGDEFAFYVDGVLETWDNERKYDGLGYFYGVEQNLFLPVGNHTFTFYITALASNNSGSGLGFVEFSEAAPVPEPATFFLFGFGALGLAGLRGKKILESFL